MKEIRPILPLVLSISLTLVAIGFLTTIFFLYDSMEAFYVNITAGMVVTGIGIVIVSFLLPTMLNRISLRRARALQEDLLIQLEGFLIQWLINFCSLAEGPEKILRQLHPAKYKLPETPIKERLTREMEPELRQWFAELVLPETVNRYRSFKPEQWQTILLNFQGYQGRIGYFKEQFGSLSASLPDITEIKFKLIIILDELNFPISLNQPFKQDLGPVMLHLISIQGEKMFSMLDCTRNILKNIR
ncbi:hypothetical protein ACFLYI_02550 [Chloroflexota bacterium]